MKYEKLMCLPYFIVLTSSQPNPIDTIILGACMIMYSYGSSFHRESNINIHRDGHDFDFKSSEISMIFILKRIQNQNHFMTSYYT